MPDQRGNPTAQPFSLDAFETVIQAFGVLKKFTCFFESANFLLTEYRLLEENTHAVFENLEGDTLQFTDMLCGYSGRGTSNTVKALMRLGVSEVEATQYCCEQQRRGLQIYFAPTAVPGKYAIEDITFSCWFEPFENPKLKNRIQLKDVSISIVKRTIAFIRPEKFGFVGLLRCLELCAPFSFAYSLDKRAPIQTERDLINSGILHHSDINASGMFAHVNLLIRGERFSIYCCISKSALIGTLNGLYYVLTGENLSTLHSYRGLVFLTDADFPVGSASLFKVLRIVIGHKAFRPQNRLPIQHSSLNTRDIALPLKARAISYSRLPNGKRDYSRLGYSFFNVRRRGKV